MGKHITFIWLDEPDFFVVTKKSGSRCPKRLIQRYGRLRSSRTLPNPELDPRRRVQNENLPVASNKAKG